MFTNVAAFLIASVAVTGAPGLFVAPSVDMVISPSATTISASAFAGGSPASNTVAPNTVALNTIAPSSAVPSRGTALDVMTGMSARDIRRFIDVNPAEVKGLLRNPPMAANVVSWWRQASAEDRAALVSGAPQIVGNLDGLPVALRNDANRVELERTIVELERSVENLGRAEQGEATQRLHMLKEIDRSLTRKAGQPQRQLLSLDTEWPGRAAVVLGDLARADYVSYMVPGMFFTVDNQMVDWTVISQDLYDEQTQWVDRLGTKDASLAEASVAVVSWIGYETPGLLDIASLDLAKDGAKFISSSVHGVQSTRSGDEPYVTLVTHSYGSTATLMALHDGAVEVDSLVIIGSPGSAAQSVDDIRMPADKVFVGEAAWDPVVDTAFFGSDPGAASFGATPMDVAGGIDPITGVELSPAVGHLGYFDAGTEAMRNMALVGLNRGDLVADTIDAPPGQLRATRR